MFSFLKWARFDNNRLGELNKIHPLRRESWDLKSLVGTGDPILDPESNNSSFLGPSHR